MSQIKIDGHVFENKYVTINHINDIATKAPVRVALGSICIKCQYEVPYVINFIEQNGVLNIIMNKDYLTCEMYAIKRLLE